MSDKNQRDRLFHRYFALRMQIPFKQQPSTMSEIMGKGIKILKVLDLLNVLSYYV